MELNSSQEAEHEWGDAREQITFFLNDVLLKIEWEYGECRAPFKIPPEFLINQTGIMTEYVCEIALDLVDEEYIIYRAESAQKLLEMIKKDIHEKFVPK